MRDDTGVWLADQAGVSSDEGMTMDDHGRRLGLVLAAAAALALLLTTLPAAAAAAASMQDCQVANLTAHTAHRSLQHAVWKAGSGDELEIQGKCSGTLVIGKDLHISGVTVVAFWDGPTESGSESSGPPTIRSGSRRPAVIVHPRVSELTIDAGIIIRGGLVVGAPAKWQRTAVPQTPRPPRWKVKPHVEPACRTERAGYDLADRVAGAAPGDELRFLGTCRGEVRIDRELTIVGGRWNLSSIVPVKGGKHRVFTSTSGPARIRRAGSEPAISVDPSVDALMLAGFTINDGFRIGPTAR